MHRVLEKFTIYLYSIRNLARPTVNSYTSSARQFLRGLADVRAINQWSVGAYIQARRVNGLLTSTIIHDIKMLKHLCRFLVSDGLLNEDPMPHIRAPQHESRIPIVPQEDEIDRILAHCADASRNMRGHKLYKCLRFRAMMTLAYSSGLRIGEISRLTESDLNTASLQVRVLGKGGKERVVPVTTKAVEAINDYLPLKHRHFPGSLFLFLSRRGRPPCEHTFNDELKKWASSAGYKAPMTPHTLRHACATHLHDRGMDLRDIQELLGHKNISTTQIYTHVTAARLSQVYRQKHPHAAGAMPLAANG